jgi:hypothetical protein
MDFGFDGSLHSFKDFGEEFVNRVFHVINRFIDPHDPRAAGLSTCPDTIGRVASASSSLISLRFFINRLQRNASSI